MKRRDLLKYTAFATGAALSAPLLLSLSSCSPDSLKKVADFKPAFFSSDQFDFVSDLVDTILPKTDSPSGSDVGVPQIIDNMVGRVYEDDGKSAYKANFLALEKSMNTDAVFTSASAAEKVAAINALQGKDLQTFKNIKQQAIAYYLSTEEIGKNYLNYLPVPGEYEGCITLESVGNKKWAI